MLEYTIHDNNCDKISFSFSSLFLSKSLNDFKFDDLSICPIKTRDHQTGWDNWYDDIRGKSHNEYRLGLFLTYRVGKPLPYTMFFEPTNCYRGLQLRYLRRRFLPLIDKTLCVPYFYLHFSGPPLIVRGVMKKWVWTSQRQKNLLQFFLSYLGGSKTNVV